MSGRKKKGKAMAKPLPKYIRDELRMTCALKAYSALKTGKSMRLPDQHAAMDKFFHGKTPTHPAQIKLLAEAHLNYCALYEEMDVTVKKKNDSTGSKTTAVSFKLKDIVTNDRSRLYYSGTDIRYEYLEKKIRVGNQLITGRNLHAMAVRGARAYKKALAYSKDKWNMVSLEPKKSGETIEDVIEYVRVDMYKDLVSSEKYDGSIDE